MNRSEIAAQYREDWAHNRQRPTGEQIDAWLKENGYTLLPWQRNLLSTFLGSKSAELHSATGRQWGVSTVKRAAQGIRADTMILDETKVLSPDDLRRMYEKPVKGFIPFSMETEPDPNQMVNQLRKEIEDHAERQFHHNIWHDMIYGPEKVRIVDKDWRIREFDKPFWFDPLPQFNILPLDLSEFRHVNPEVDIFDPEGNRQRTINYIKARYGTLQGWEGYPVAQDNKGLFQTQPGNFMQGRKNGKSPIMEGREPLLRHDLEQRITNQRKELKRLNACLKLQGAQAIQQNRRYDIRKRHISQLEDSEARLERDLQHERAMVAYWHSKYKDLKKGKKK